jgi:hypothetical protein
MELDAGFPWRSHVVQNTSGWLGPYNLVLPANQSALISRYVTTASTDYLQAPENCTIITSALFDASAGATAVHQSILRQPDLRPGEDPYAEQRGTCDQGDLKPILPRFTMSKHNSFTVDFPLLSLPDSPKDPLYKLWPSFQYHLPHFPVSGPYCYAGDSKRAYAINVNYDSRTANSSAWQLTDGCVPGLPCWPKEHANNHTIPNDGGGGTTDVDLNKALLTYGCYFLGLAFVISLTFNCQLSYQLKRLRERFVSAPTTRSTQPTTSTSAPSRPPPRTDLEQPLLPTDEAELDPAPLQPQQDSEASQPQLVTSELGGA